MDAQQSPSLSWRGAEKYLAENAKGCLPYLPLLRDGRMCWNASVINTIENERWETFPTKLKLDLTLNSPVDLATITKDSWAKELTELKNRFPYLSILGRKAAEAELATMPLGSTMGYDASRGFISSIGINLERYREKTLRDPSIALKMVQSQQTNKKAKLSHGAPIEAPIEEPMEPTLGVPIVSIATGQPAATTRLPTTEFPFKRLTRGDQLESACGTNTELVAYAKERYGNKPGGMTREQVKRWYKKDMANRLPSRFIGKEFGLQRGDIQVCHIISTANGGHDWIYNYYIDLAEVNHHFGKHMSKEWDDYIGRDAKGHAESFSRWAAKKLKGIMPFGSFDPISDYYTARS